MNAYKLTAIGLLIVSALLVLRRMRGLMGTTLVAPVRWLLLAVAVLGFAVVAEGMGQLADASQAALRYLAATCTLCPLMAVLGAKRPQDKGWQFIVGSMWLILILPVGEMFFLWRGGAMDVGPMRSWFLVILLGVGVTNYALTRFAVAAVIATVGMASMLSPHLPVPEPWKDWQPSFIVGIVVVSVALFVVSWQVRCAPREGGWNAVWVEFRNAFGLVWGLRVMERINETARLGNWNAELTWFGFDAENLEAAPHSEVEKAMRTTLRRFVSSEWIEKRHAELP